MPQSRGKMKVLRTMRSAARFRCWTPGSSLVLSHADTRPRISFHAEPGQSIARLRMIELKKETNPMYRQSREAGTLRGGRGGESVRSATPKM